MNIKTEINKQIKQAQEELVWYNDKLKMHKKALDKTTLDQLRTRAYLQDRISSLAEAVKGTEEKLEMYSLIIDEQLERCK